MRLLGSSYNEIEAPDAANMDPSEILAAKCNYYNKLASMTVGNRNFIGSGGGASLHRAHVVVRTANHWPKDVQVVTTNAADAAEKRYT